ncbi:hypothetical protein So717_26590 [Roseobacter cerasinus]|uniref:Type VI secretion system FHA domain-containing protein n=1 Tax=Roseobacter cerasinus TaxID=2602289 RepID=A0A640VXG4_9RHOB|nr:type VI secretion system-associated FHA domain protein [Roseobacter cerasinus]GFE50906.1 hypothetical protein So717_26590 [Roseobacter cerasinus]
MQLKIELITGPAAGEVRLVGGTETPFVIGTSAGATWRLPLTQEAPGDIRIAPTSDGLMAVLQSGTAYLDQRALTADMPRALLPGAVLMVAGHQLRAAGSMADALVGDDTTTLQPTVSSILSRAAQPATVGSAQGSTAEKEDWISALTTTPAPRAEWMSLGSYEKTGKPQVEEDPLGAVSAPSGPFLPPDWDLTTAPSETSTRMTQSRLAEVTLRIGRALPATDTEEPAPSDPAVDAFLKGVQLLPEEVQGDLPAQMQAFGRMLRDLLDAVARLEDAQAQIGAELDLANPLPHAATRQADATLMSVSKSPAFALQLLSTRLADLEAGTRALWSGIQSFARRAGETFDPDLIEAATDAQGGVSARLNRSGAAWATYRSRYAAAPLTEAALADAIRQAMPPASEPTDPNTTQEERPR